MPVPHYYLVYTDNQLQPTQPRTRSSLSLPFYLHSCLFRDLRLLNHRRQARHIIRCTTLELNLASPNFGPHLLPSSGVGRSSLTRNTDELGPVLAVDVFKIRVAAELFVELIRRYVGAQVLVELKFFASLAGSANGPKLVFERVILDQETYQRINERVDNLEETPDEPRDY